MPPDWQAIFNFIQLIGWPGAALVAQGRGLWYSRNYVENERAQHKELVQQIRDAASAALAERDKHHQEIVVELRDRYDDKCGECDEWRALFFEGKEKIVRYEQVTEAMQTVAPAPPQLPPPRPSRRR